MPLQFFDTLNSRLPQKSNKSFVSLNRKANKMLKKRNERKSVCLCCESASMNVMLFLDYFIHFPSWRLSGNILCYRNILISRLSILPCLFQQILFVRLSTGFRVCLFFNFSLSLVRSRRLSTRLKITNDDRQLYIFQQLLSYILTTVPPFCNRVKGSVSEMRVGVSCVFLFFFFFFLFAFFCFLISFFFSSMHLHRYHSKFVGHKS